MSRAVPLSDGSYFDDTRQRLVGGLAVASDADIVALDTVATGPSAGKIDLADAVALAVRGL